MTVKRLIGIEVACIRRGEQATHIVLGCAPMCERCAYQGEGSK